MFLTYYALRASKIPPPPRMWEDTLGRQTPTAGYATAGAPAFDHENLNRPFKRISQLWLVVLVGTSSKSLISVL